MTDENLILVNASHPCPCPVPEDLEPVKGVLLRREAAQALVRLITEVGGEAEITAVSGWRSEEEQAEIYCSSLRDNGLEFTEKYVALPGHSEHQTGLAVDVGLNLPDIDFICPAFPEDGVCGRFRSRAADFGFILRYPAGREAVTGIANEPWHFRYVGLPHSKIIEEKKLTLEEYLNGGGVDE